MLIVLSSRHSPTAGEIQQSLSRTATGRRTSSFRNDVISARSTATITGEPPSSADMPPRNAASPHFQDIPRMGSGAELIGQGTTTRKDRENSSTGPDIAVLKPQRTKIESLYKEWLPWKSTSSTHDPGTPARTWRSGSPSMSGFSSGDTESDMNPQVLDFLKTRFIEEVPKVRARTTSRLQRNDLYRTEIEAQDQEPGATGGSKTKGTAVSPASESSNGANLKRGREISDDSQAKDGSCKPRKMTSRPGSGLSGKRLACLYHKYRPLVYRKNDQTGAMFDCCATHDFENMHRLL